MNSYALCNKDLVSPPPGFLPPLLTKEEENGGWSSFSTTSSSSMSSLFSENGSLLLGQPLVHTVTPSPDHHKLVSPPIGVERKIPKLSPIGYERTVKNLASFGGYPNKDSLLLSTKERRPDETTAVILNYKGQVLRLEAELEECQDKLAKEQALTASQQKQLDYILLELLPSLEKSRCSNNHQTDGEDAVSLLDGSTLVQETKNNQVGDYAIGPLLGRGKYGTVYQCHHVETQEPHALKVMERPTCDKARGHLALEVHVLQTVNHANIVSLHQVLEGPDKISLVMDLCQTDLYTYTQENPRLDTVQVRECLLGILEPLQYLHELGICHLDLKQENVLVKRKRRQGERGALCREDIVLADFGFCAVASGSDSITPNHVPLAQSSGGTPGFMAPEMVRQRRAVVVGSNHDTTTRVDPVSCEGCTADMWSVGCILLDLAEGFTEAWQEAYSQWENGEYGTFEMALYEALVDVRDVEFWASHQAHDVANRLLQVSPSTRPTAREMLQHDWFAAASAKNAVSPSTDLLLPKEFQSLTPTAEFACGMKVWSL